MIVGTVVKLRTKCLNNMPGTKGICYETYNVEQREGASIIFENGKYDGFSPEEQKEILIPLGFNEDLMNYKFESVMKLSEDYEVGMFSKIFISSDESK